MINTYAYVDGNPVNHTDRLGLETDVFDPQRPYYPGPIEILFPGTPANNTWVQGVNQVVNAISSSASSGSQTNVYDKSGRKVSPKACVPPPGNCSPYEQQNLQNDVNNACKRPRACKAGMNQVELFINRENSRECAIARDAINNKCFFGGNAGHRDAAIDAWNSVANCDALIR